MTLKLNLKTPIGVFLVEGAAQFDVFKQIAVIQEVFSDSECGLCASPNIRYVARECKKKVYPELHCVDCQARLAFGLNQEPKLGSMYPKRRLTSSGKPDMKNGELGAHNGWSKYKGDPADE